MKKIFFLFGLLLFFLYGCPDPESENNDSIGIAARLTYDPLFEEDITIAVLRDVSLLTENAYIGDEVTDATVTINDIPIPYDDPWGYTDDGTLITLTPGNDYTIKVVCDGSTYEQTVSFPPLPDITSHSHGDSWDAAVPTTLTWTMASTTHDENKVSIWWMDTQNEEDYEAILPATTTSHEIPGGILESGVSYLPGVKIRVITRTKVTDNVPDFHNDSFVLCENESYVMVATD